MLFTLVLIYSRLESVSCSHGSKEEIRLRESRILLKVLRQGQRVGMVGSSPQPLYLPSPSPTALTATPATIQPKKNVMQM